MENIHWNGVRKSPIANIPNIQVSPINNAQENVTLTLPHMSFFSWYLDLIDICVCIPLIIGTKRERFITMIQATGRMVATKNTSP